MWKTSWVFINCREGTVSITTKGALDHGVVLLRHPKIPCPTEEKKGASTIRSRDTFSFFSNSGEPVARYLIPYFMFQKTIHVTSCHRWCGKFAHINTSYMVKSFQAGAQKSSNFGLSNIAAAGTPTKWKVFSRNERGLPRPKTNIAPENTPSQKEMLIFQLSIF